MLLFSEGYKMDHETGIQHRHGHFGSAMPFVSRWWKVRIISTKNLTPGFYILSDDESWFLLSLNPCGKPHYDGILYFCKLLNCRILTLVDSGINLFFLEGGAASTLTWGMSSSNLELRHIVFSKSHSLHQNNNYNWKTIKFEALNFNIV